MLHCLIATEEPRTEKMDLVIPVFYKRVIEKQQKEEREYKEAKARWEAITGKMPEYKQKILGIW